MKVYLAGAMEQKSNRGARWREILGDKLESWGWEVFDPVLEEDMELVNDPLLDGRHVSTISKTNKDYEVIADKIWQRDMDLIAQSDLLVVYLDEPVFRSSGTLCEMSHAKDYNIPMVILRKVPLKDIPLWTRASFKDNYVATSMSDVVQYLGNLNHEVNECSYQ